MTDFDGASFALGMVVAGCFGLALLALAMCKVAGEADDRMEEMMRAFSDPDQLDLEVDTLANEAERQREAA